MTKRFCRSEEYFSGEEKTMLSGCKKNLPISVASGIKSDGNGEFADATLSKVDATTRCGATEFIGKIIL
jgi:hypothetical protein